MSVYRESSSRFDDSRSVASGRTTGGTRVTRYIVKEDESDRRSQYGDGRRSTAGTRYDDRRTEVDIRASREEEEPRRAYSRYDGGDRVSRETITIRREKDESPRRNSYWNRPAGEDVEDRELVIKRSSERDVGERALSRVEDSRDTVVVSRQDDRRESRFSDYEVVSPQRGSFDERDREVQRYIRTTDYYQNQQPQTIIIRQDPIIIRETVRDRPREEEYAVIKKSDVEEERSVSHRSRSVPPRDEEYFYEKRVRERIPEDDRERRMRRQVSPGDSISQVGARGRSRGYESDDSMVYVRKERTEYSGGESPDRKKSLAAGALAGVGAAELIRNHNRKEGKETSHGAGRVAKDVGAGVVGAVVAEGIRRYRSKSRKGSRSRSGSRDRRSRYSRRSRSRSRSRSSSNGRFGNMGGLGGLALAAAAVGAGALIASKNKKEVAPAAGGRRGRSSSRGGSRSRASSVASRVSELENDPNAQDDRNPSRRNKKTAAAGALGAAAMALYEHHRSKSRGRGRSESPNRVKQGVPVVLAGLGAAALAHQFEKRKAHEEAEEIVRDEGRRSRSRSRRSRSRGGRADSTYYDGPAQRAYSDPNLIQYGTEPLYGNNYGEGYYGRPSVEQDYYHNNTRDIVPAPAPPPATSSFDATSRRPTDAGRTRSISSSRSRSRNRDVAAAGAVGAGVAAAEMDKRHRKDKKDRKRRSRQRSRGQSYSPPQSDDRSRAYSYAPYTAGRDPYEDANWHATHSASYAQGMNDPYASQTGFTQFPPPPGSIPQPAYTPQPAYAPQQAHGQQSYGPQDFPPPPPGAPQAYQANNHFAPNQNPYAPRSGRADENVSAASFPASTDQHHSTENGVNQPRELAMSPPLVGPNVTVQRPSVSTPVNQPRNKFPGNPVNPFHNVGRQNPDGSAAPSPGTASPGTRPESGSPGAPTTRAAKAYTPTPPIQSERSPSAQPNPQTPNDQDRAIPVVTDSPSPVAGQRPEPPEDPRVTAFRQAAYNAPPLQKPQPDTRNATASPQPMSEPRSVSPRPQPSKSPPILNEGKRSMPVMPSPDIRPPSDEWLATPQQRRAFLDQNDSAPSMPSLFIPERSNPITQPPETYESPTEIPERRERDRSESLPRGEAPNDSEMSHKKSVSFNPRPEFSEAPPPASSSRRHSRHVSDSDRDRDRDDGEGSRRRRHERDRDGHRSHDHHRHGYDAGDDFSDDTPFEDHRRRSQDGSSRSSRHSSRRERSNTQSLDRESGTSRDADRTRDPKRSNTMSSADGDSSSKRDSRRRSDRHRDRDPSPSGSEETVDLPERFDERGRRKPSYGDGKRSPEQDMIAESLDQILGGWLGGSNKKKR